MAFRREDSLVDQKKKRVWISYPQKKMLGMTMLDRFEWNKFMIYHTNEDIHLFRQPPTEAIYDNLYYTEYSLVSIKN
jgi:hypothetical protein